MELLSPEEEMLKIRDIAVSSQTRIKEGDLFYLIAQRWWQHWIDYVNHDRIVDVSSSFDDSDIVGSVTLRRPHSIDNSELIFDTPSDETELHDTLVEGRDYVLLPEDVWNQLYLWYGGGPTLERKVIKCFLPQMELMVEVFPLRLCLTVLPKGGSSTIRISKKDCVGELHRRACEIFELSKERVNIWDYFGHQKHALMKDMEKTIDDFNIQMGQDILVEVDNETNGICLTTSKNGSRSCSSDISQNQSLNSPVTDLDNSYGVSGGVSTRGSSGGGLTGLLNLGNTCFMNSAIQCLVHTPQFAAYFQDDFYQEINWNNPLGMVGELALAFGELLRKLWAPSRTPVSPRPFKSKLARFAPQFSGYNQHDSQELLAFLLDGLHEDLNRVKERPYVKSKDANDRPDEEVANEYWANHIARNDSIIVDVCQGQYKSTLVCPVCGKVSVTFDPFMYLSLPLQSAATRTMTVTVFTCDGSALPDVCTITVPKLGRCRDLIQALSSACSLDPTQKFLLVEIKGHLIHRFLEDPFIQLSAIRDEEHLAAYKIPKLPKNIIFLQLIHRREEQVTSGAQGKLLWTPYGTPLVSPISCDELVTRRDLRMTVLKMLSPLRSITEKAVSLSSSSSSMVAETETPKSGCHNLLPLQLVDVDNACIDLSICDEKVVKLSPAETSMLIFMNWSGKLLEEYDTHYLEHLQPVSKNGPATKKTRSELISLYSCLDAFLREEPLVPEDMWYCPHCEEMRQASKKLDLWRLPEVLVIHLKRFSYSRSMKHKLETFVNFPVHHFDLTNYVAHDNTGTRREIYDLYALTNHYGGMGSGHYTAHIKMENKWYNFDDNHISGISAEEVKSAAAYVLFYTRVKT